MTDDDDAGTSDSEQPAVDEETADAAGAESVTEKIKEWAAASDAANAVGGGDTAPRASVDDVLPTDDADDGDSAGEDSGDEARQDDGDTDEDAGDATAGAEDGTAETADADASEDVGAEDGTDDASGEETGDDAGEDTGSGEGAAGAATDPTGDGELAPVPDLLDRVAAHDETLADEVEDALEETRELAEEVDHLETTLAHRDEELAAREEQLSDVHDELEALRTELQNREEEVADLEERLRRKQADFKNYKERRKRKEAELRDRATEGLVERLVDVRNNLVRALQDESGDVDALREGVRMTLNTFDRVLDAENVETIDPDAGADVEPERHEVVTRIASEQPEGAVAEVYQPGYEMAGKVLETAKVTVSDGPADGGGDDGGEDDETGAEGDGDEDGE